MPSSAPSNHHYVPRYYLRNFGIPAQGGKKPVWIAAYDRKHGVSNERKAIRSVASETDFYMLDPALTQDPYVLETGFFGDVDKMGSELLRGIINENAIPQELQPRLREHLAVQVVRTKWFREYVRERAPKVWKMEQVMKMAAKGPPTGLTDALRDVYWKELEKQITSGWDPLGGRNEVIDLTIGRFNTFRAGLEQFTCYQLVWFNHPAFLTSDNPIVLRHDGSGVLNSPMHLGLNESSELWYPITPQIGILLTRFQLDVRRVVTVEIPRVLELNTAVARMSHRWVLWKPGSVAPQFVELPPPAKES